MHRRQTSWEATAIILERDGDLGFSSATEIYKKQSDSEYVLKVETTGFPDGLHVGFERREESRITPSFLA